MTITTVHIDPSADGPMWTVAPAPAFRGSVDEEHGLASEQVVDQVAVDPAPLKMLGVPSVYLETPDLQRLLISRSHSLSYSL